VGVDPWSRDFLRFTFHIFQHAADKIFHLQPIANLVSNTAHPSDSLDVYIVMRDDQPIDSRARGLAEETLRSEVGLVLSGGSGVYSTTMKKQLLSRLAPIIEP
jgi:hypothetical protein